MRLSRRRSLTSSGPRPSIRSVGKTVVLPVNVVLPAITGTTGFGDTLTSSTGTWTGTAPITYTYQWQRGGVDISGETAATHVIVAADLGTTLTCEVTATNAAGAVMAESAGTAVPWHPLALLPEVLYDPAILDHTITGAGISLKPNKGTLGSVFDMVQTVDANRPVFSASSANMNSRAAILGDGVDFLTQAAADVGLDRPAGGSMEIVSVVFKSAATSDYLWGTNPLTSDRVELQYDTTAGRWQYASTDMVSNNHSTTTPSVARWRVDGVTPARYSRTDDTQSGTDATPYGLCDPGASGWLWQLGPNRNAGPLTGEWGFLMHLNRILTAPELVTLTTWVNAQFGLSLTSV